MTLVWGTFLAFGVGVLLGGVAFFLNGWTLAGVALLLGGVTLIFSGVAGLYRPEFRPELLRRMVAWLTKRDDQPPKADGENPQLADEEATPAEAETQGEPGPT